MLGGSWQARETKDSPNNDEDGAMNSFETTGRSVGVQTAVRQKSQSTGDGYVICNDMIVTHVRMVMHILRQTVNVDSF